MADRGAGTPRRIVWTDGGCTGNPGPGGYAAVIVDPDDATAAIEIREGTRPDTTNNRMELGAAYMGLRACPATARILVVTDSQYLQRGMCEWRFRWAANGWRDAHGDAVKNAELWQSLIALQEKRRDVSWRWTRAHQRDGDAGNRLADRRIKALLRAQRRTEVIAHGGTDDGRSDRAAKIDPTDTDRTGELKRASEEWLADWD